MKVSCFLILGVLFWASQASSDEQPAQQPTFTIAVDPQLSSPQAFEGLGTAVVPLRKTEGVAPRKDERDRLFATIRGLNKIISPWDALDKDLLYIRAQHRGLDQLSATYPQVPKSILAALQKALEEKRQ